MSAIIRNGATLAALALAALFATACSEGGEAPSIVSEAVAGTPGPADYGWKTNGEFGTAGDVKEYY